MEPTEQPTEFEKAKTRLEEIARAVDDENLSLDEALDLYEEAVKLGLQASNLLDIGIVVEEEPAEGEAAAEGEGAAADASAPEAADTPEQAPDRAPSN